MSGELNLKFSATNKTILALILGQNRTTRWNGSAMVAINTVSDANWTTGMVTLTEQTTSNNTKTATYVGDFPSAIATAGEYVVEYYLSTAAVPGSPAIGVQDIWWSGSAAIRPLAISETKDGLANLEVDIALINGNTVNDDGNGSLLPPFFDSLLTRTGSTRTVIQVKGTDQYAVWGENVLRGSTLYYEEVNGASPRYFPAVILSNSAINSTSGTITLAGDGFPAAPENANEQLALTVNSHASVIDVKTKTDAIPANPAAVGSAMTLQSAERDAIATALLDLANTVDGKTLRQALRIISAVLAGKVSGAGTGTETFRALDDLSDRVVVTADVTGNRTSVTYP